MPQHNTVDTIELNDPAGAPEPIRTKPLAPETRGLPLEEIERRLEADNLMRPSD